MTLMGDDRKAVLIPLRSKQVRYDRGHAYIWKLPPDVPRGDCEENNWRSTAVLFEDGVALGPAHCRHDIVREQGYGRFSHWENQVFFSASDNTRPLRNGRAYHLCLPTDLIPDPEWSSTLRATVSDLSTQERFELARRAFVRIWGNMPLPDHGRRIEHDDGFAREFARLSPEGTVTFERKYNLNELFQLVHSVAGDVAECGCYKGASAFFLARQIMQASLAKDLLLFDSFEGLSKPEALDATYWMEGDLSATEDDVWKSLAPLPPVPFVMLYKGWIPERFLEVAHRRFCFVHIDVDLYQPTLHSMSFFYPRLSPGGIILLDDYGFVSCPGVTEAVDQFMADKPEPIVNFASGGAFVMKQVGT